MSENDGIYPAIIASLEEHDDELRNIVQQALRIQDDTERYMAVVSSGYAAGWLNKPEEDSRHPPPAPELYKEVRATLALMDAAILGYGQQTMEQALIQAHNSLTSALKRERDEQKKSIHAALAESLGQGTADLIFKDTLTDEDAFQVGHVYSCMRTAYFVGFASLYGDSRVRCQCPVHLAEGATEHGVTTDIAFARAKERYGSMSAALSAFGHFMAQSLRTAIDQWSPIGQSGEIDIDAVHQESTGFLTRLIRGKNDDTPTT